MSQEIKQLIEGNKEFRKKFFGPENTLFDELVAHGQKPKTMIIACSDSRVDPAMIFNCDPGELFVVRNIANLIPPCETNDTYHGVSSALEFGVCILNVRQIIILGHTHCGGIKALLEMGSNLYENQHRFIAKWMEIALPAYKKTIAEHAEASFQEKSIICERYALINSLHNVQTFPWIKKRVLSGAISLHVWYFDLASGGIHQYDPEKERWVFE